MAEQEQEQEQDSKEQPLISHLIELRDRLLRCMLVIVVLLLCFFPFGNELYIIVSQPLIKVMPENASMIATSPTAPFMTPFKLSLVAAIFTAIPFLLHQAWAFISPGLYKNEIRVAFPILVSSVILFYTGVAFAYFIVFQYIFAFFIGSAPETVTVMTDITQYLDFVLALFFVFGLVFEIPIATLLLIFSGVVTPDALVEKRPYIIIGCFVAGMLLTPQDPMSMFFVAVPMWLLFEVGVIAGRIMHKADDSEEDESSDSEKPDSSSST